MVLEWIYSNWTSNDPTRATMSRYVADFAVDADVTYGSIALGSIIGGYVGGSVAGTLGSVVGGAIAGPVGAAVGVAVSMIFDGVKINKDTSIRNYLQSSLSYGISTVCNTAKSFASKAYNFIFG